MREGKPKIDLPERRHLDSTVICKVGIPGHIQPFIGRHSQPEDLNIHKQGLSKVQFPMFSLLAGFHPGPLSCSKWNLETWTFALVFRMISLYISVSFWSNLQKMATKRISLFDFALFSKEWLFYQHRTVKESIKLD